MWTCGSGVEDGVGLADQLLGEGAQGDLAVGAAPGGDAVGDPGAHLRPLDLVTLAVGGADDFGDPNTNGVMNSPC